MWVTRLCAASAIAVVVVGATPAAAMTRAGIVTVSVSRSGGPANGNSETASLSEGGR